MAPAGIGADLAGVHAIAAALAAGRVELLTVERRRATRDDVAALIVHAEEAGVIVHVVEDVGPLAGTDRPQGVVATATPIVLVSLEECLASNDPAAVVVLDHVEDPRNTGAVVRSMVAAGMRGLVVPGRRSAPLGATAFKAAAGAFESASVAVVGSIPEALRQLSRLGVWTIGLTGAGERSLFGLDLLGEPCALVFGAEGAGLSRLAGERVDVTARIPMGAGVESLNVSAAAAIACFEVARVRTPVQ
ncbi:MAG TPA: RNA methyltransferase [Acidimicrobiia bacterium]|jgi:23S rRNA (guanosine2251-2'-O)-methyltransferase